MYSLETIKDLDRERIKEYRGVEPYQAVVDGDEGVFKCPMKARRIKGYSLIKEYFVDNSGFGQEGEGALTAREFLQKVKEGMYYAIISCGQFQVYIGEYIKRGV